MCLQNFKIFFIRVTKYIYSKLNCFIYLSLSFQDAVSVIGGAIGAMRIPEKWFPGLVDYYLNSHNIMHVLVVLAVYSMHMVSIISKKCF